MERDTFLLGISARLGRPIPIQAPIRSSVGVSDRYSEHPFGTSEISVVDWPDLFQRELEAIGGKVEIAEQLSDIPGFIRQALGTVSGSYIATWARSEFDGWPVGFLWVEIDAKPYASVSELVSADQERLVRQAKVGITTVDYGIVNTGAIALYTNTNRNRSISLLPALHIALIRQSQLVPRLGLALPHGSIHNGIVPSSVHFISGPSRSADIENDLSIGVHGPAALTAIICRGI